MGSTIVNRVSAFPTQTIHDPGPTFVALANLVAQPLRLKPSQHFVQIQIHIPEFRGIQRGGLIDQPASITHNELDRSFPLPQENPFTGRGTAQQANFSFQWKRLQRGKGRETLKAAKQHN